MHELSLCQNIIDQVTALARTHRAAAVRRIEVRIGVLSGVEPMLLAGAFPFAAAGTIAEAAELVTEEVTPLVRCLACGADSEAAPGDLRCGRCASTETRLVRGGELILARVELVPAGHSVAATEGA